MTGTNDYIVISYRVNTPGEYGATLPVNTLEEIHEAKLAMHDAGIE
jgi:hypothetical protein